MRCHRSRRWSGIEVSGIQSHRRAIRPSKAACSDESESESTQYSGQEAALQSPRDAVRQPSQRNKTVEGSGDLLNQSPVFLSRRAQLFHSLVVLFESDLATR